MSRSLERMTRLIEEMVTVSAVMEGKLPFRRTRRDLVDICRAAIQQMPLAGRTPVLDLPEGPLEVEVDGDRIAQVVMNLVSNAIKYSAPDRPVTLVVRKAAQAAIVSVRDEGAGIGADELSHVFERFYRAPSVDVQAGSHMGLGLGLFISRAIIEQHGGRIWAESEIGRGSTFSFSLPLPADQG
jgi:signal transduction histidine kinase